MASSLLDREVLFANSEFGLDVRLTKATSKLGFIYPTLVQTKFIPLALAGKDVLARARTGSGKTAAYGLPVLQKVLASKAALPDVAPCTKAVILVPTRELCDQTRNHIYDLMYYCRDVVSILALADESMSAQQAHLRDKPDIVVSTPSRLVSHLEAQNLDLKEGVETLVIDEADLVLSFGYADDVQKLTGFLPAICQCFLMSATLSPDLRSLQSVMLNSPVMIFPNAAAILLSW